MAQAGTIFPLDKIAALQWRLRQMPGSSLELSSAAAGERHLSKVHPAQKKWRTWLQD
jgi:hypothetical protein